LHPIEEYILPYYQLNINASEYVIGTGFGKTTGDSPCRVSPGHSYYTTSIGGANQKDSVDSQSS